MFARALILLLLAAPAWGQTRENLPIPRFASIRADEVNMRTGPGERYPIEWVVRRRNLPVEIIAEFEQWRRIREPTGGEGWVHMRLLAGRRTVMVLGRQNEIRQLFRRPEAGAPVIARVEPGVVGELLECQGEWCRMDAGGNRGWLRRTEIWGVYPNETMR